MLFLGRSGGAHQGEDPVCFHSVGGPDLAAGADQIITVVDGGHLQRCQIRAGLRFGVALAEEHLAGEDAGQEVILLFGCAEGDDRVGHHVNSHGGQRRCPGEGGLAAEDVMLGQRPIASAVLDRPRRRRPAAFVQDRLPGHAGLVIGVDAGHQPARLAQVVGQFLVQEGPHFVAEFEIFRRPRQVHPGHLLSACDVWRNARRSARRVPVSTFRLPPIGGRQRSSREGSGQLTSTRHLGRDSGVIDYHPRGEPR